MKFLLNTIIGIALFTSCHSARNEENNITPNSDSTEKIINQIQVDSTSDLVYLIQQPSIKEGSHPLFILMHGFGSNEQDLFELKDLFPKNYIIVSPRAPMTLQEGAYEWYSNRDSAGSQIPNGKEVYESEQKVLSLIQNIEQKYSVDTSNIYLGGFSQGANMSYAIGLSHPEIIKGIAIFSGKILAPVYLQIASVAALKKLKIFAGHGNADDRIPYEEAKKSVHFLTSKGIPVDFHTYENMQHQISTPELNDFQKWLNK